MFGELPTNWLSEFEGRIERDVLLSPLTWYRLGGRARYLYRPPDEAQLVRMTGRARQEGVLTRVLGGGANVLIRDHGVDGVVIRLDAPVFRKVEFQEDLVIAGGGAELMRLTLDCARRGLAGLECLAGIPGTVGGAIRGNAGGRYGEIGERVTMARLLTPEGEIEVRSREELGFSYRRSNLGARIVLSADFELHQEEPERVLARFNEIWAEKKVSQPFSANSAGCVFKNPPGRSAGKLIDQAGLKGCTVGAASVSQEHANFIVTRPGATAADVLRLVDQIRDVVRTRFSVELELEIDIW